MEWYEIIHIRLFNRKDREEAMSVFSQLNFPKFNKGIKAVKLLQDIFLDNDLRILIQWQKGDENAKSIFGLHLVALLERFGRIHHIVCKELSVEKKE